MSIEIKPQDVHFLETNNDVSVRTTVPKELLEDGALILPHARRMALPADTEIRVSVMNEARDVLLHTAKFRVWEAVETRQREMDPAGHGERVVRRVAYVIARSGPWDDSPKIRHAPVCTKPPELQAAQGLQASTTDDASPEPGAKRGPGRPRKTAAA